METTNLDHNELFEAYHKGQLSAEALQQFEQLLNSSENIQQEFKEYLILAKTVELIEKPKATPKADIDQLVEIANAVEQRTVSKPEPKVIPLWRKVVNISTAAALAGAAFLGVMISLEIAKPENPMAHLKVEEQDTYVIIIGLGAAKENSDQRALALYNNRNIEHLKQHTDSTKTYQSQYLLGLLLLSKNQSRVNKDDLTESIRLFKAIRNRSDVPQSAKIDATWCLANCYLSFPSQREDGKELLRELAASKAESEEAIARWAKLRLEQIQNKVK